MTAMISDETQIELAEPEALEKLMDVMTLAGQLEERAAYSDIVTTEFAEKAIETVKFE